MRVRNVHAATLPFVLAAACGGHIGGDGDDGGSGTSTDARAGSGDGGNGTCDAPDMLILLDRTESMHKRPDGSTPSDTPEGYAQSKWSIAIGAIETMSADLDETIRFGLALFPRDPANGSCITLKQKIEGGESNNPRCEAGEVVAAPAVAAGGTLASALDPMTTLLCHSTPIGKGMETARTTLEGVRVEGRHQYVVFVGDGEDTCDQSDLAVQTAQALARAGVKTFVISFDASGGTNPKFLNDLSCAGQTAVGFPAPCTADGAGNYTATDPEGTLLFLSATDGPELDDRLHQVAGSVCCGCVE